MAVSTTPVSGAAVQSGPSARQALLDSYVRESATTLKVLYAYPAEHADLRPHFTSNSAQQLAWTFAIENSLVEAALRSELRDAAGFSADASGVARLPRCVRAGRAASDGAIERTA